MASSLPAPVLRAPPGGDARRRARRPGRARRARRRLGRDVRPGAGRGRLGRRGGAGTTGAPGAATSSSTGTAPASRSCRWATSPWWWWHAGGQRAAAGRGARGEPGRHQHRAPAARRGRASPSICWWSTPTTAAPDSCAARGPSSSASASRASCRPTAPAGSPPVCADVERTGEPHEEEVPTGVPGTDIEWVRQPRRAPGPRPARRSPRATSPAAAWRRPGEPRAAPHRARDRRTARAAARCSTCVAEEAVGALGGDQAGPAPAVGRRARRPGRRRPVRRRPTASGEAAGAGARHGRGGVPRRPRRARRRRRRRPRARGPRRRRVGRGADRRGAGRAPGGWSGAAPGAGTGCGAAMIAPTRGPRRPGPAGRRQRRVAGPRRSARAHRRADRACRTAARSGSASRRGRPRAAAPAPRWPWRSSTSTASRASTTSTATPIGDQVLCAVSEALRATVREGELLARVGGEEFGWILPGADLEAVVAAAERARACGRRGRVPGVERVDDLRRRRASCGPTEASDLQRAADRGALPRPRRARRVDRGRTAESQSGGRRSRAIVTAQGRIASADRLPFVPSRGRRASAASAPPSRPRRREHVEHMAAEQNVGKIVEIRGVVLDAVFEDAPAGHLLGARDRRRRGAHPDRGGAAAPRQRPGARRGHGRHRRPARAAPRSSTPAARSRCRSAA